MKTIVRKKLLGWLLMLGVLSVEAQQDCKDEINYSISNVTLNGAGVNYVATDDNIIQVTIGQPYVGFNGSRQQGIRSNGGFWGFYNAEPQAPIASASEGEYVDRIEVEWEVVDDYTGPQVTETLTQVFRNGRLLTTVPLNQTSYVDYNVFPGEFYTYEIVTTNQFGDAKPIEAVGFLNPNGRVTGKVETRNGTPVSDVKVVLTPNLGRSLDFDGTQDYVYFLDQSFKFDSTYTVEGWWRNVETKAQTIFSAVDSGTTNTVLKISLDDEGRLIYFHDGDADGTGIELSSRDGYNLDQFSRGWHHFAAVYDTASVFLYVDGNRVAESAIDDPITVNTELEIGKEGPKLYTNYYAGFLDDFRIWNDARSREEVRRFKEITLTGEEEDLSVYWKFDEQFSNKVFDFAAKPVEEREHGYLCEVDRSDFISPAQLGAYTDAGGDYIIKGVFYGGGQTFQVTPSKSTPVGFSLEFDGTDDFISFQRERVVLDEEFTLEGWFKTGVDGQQMTLFEATDTETDEV
ncbi:MAG: LamG domain-containing protein, partial [Ekhidna sp.]|nr:LamG domain-containing protein [Ekhidna sp.]